VLASGTSIVRCSVLALEFDLGSDVLRLTVSLGFLEVLSNLCSEGQSFESICLASDGAVGCLTVDHSFLN